MELTFEQVQEQVKDVQTATFGGRLVVAVLEMRNGYLITGQSLCNSAETFNQDVAEELAVQDALQKAFQFEMYAKRSAEGIPDKDQKSVQLPASS